MCSALRILKGIEIKVQDAFMFHTVKDGDDNAQISRPYSNYDPDTQRLGLIVNNLEETGQKGRAGGPVRSMSTSDLPIGSSSLPKPLLKLLFHSLHLQKCYFFS